MNAPFRPTVPPVSPVTPSSPDQLRVAAIMRKFGISYPAFEAIADELCDMIAWEDAEPQHVAVHACSRNGATWLAKHIRDRFPVQLNILQDAAVQRVAYVALPAFCSVQYFAMKILDELREPYNPRSSKAHLASSAYACLKALGTRTIIIDRAKRLSDGYETEVKAMKNVVTEIAEECGLSVFMFGDEDAADLHTQSTAAINNLFETRGLPLWQDNEDFQRLLMQFEQSFPLRERSDLAQDGKIITTILDESGGRIDHIGKLLRRCGVHAIRSGREKIDMKTLAECGWVKPSDRRAKVRALIGAPNAPAKDPKPRKRAR